MKVDLGSGPIESSVAGYLRVDLWFEYRPDVLADISKPLPFAGESFEKVLTINTIEHLPASSHRLLASEVHRVLKPHGCWKGTTHDWDCICMQYFEGKISYEETMRQVYGGAYAHEPELVLQEHKACFTYPVLKSLLESAGFEVDFSESPGATEGDFTKAWWFVWRALKR